MVVVKTLVIEPIRNAVLPFGAPLLTSVNQKIGST